ncbi:hypothetical protein LTR70_006363 [Exophiala xenobiotica]|uniref:Uncharacterized protein n=1 Tax=Lithohypha guttulata TaxID=1690604 RepID=A0ABR0K836_9EURO|nr:hypothetical protein LTR24_005832 [Lithohypha guttulata]KAK5316308.1 hypothetical protein LTR70_006363 [Exophiala xenobiotica]
MASTIDTDMDSDMYPEEVLDAGYPHFRLRMSEHLLRDIPSLRADTVELVMQKWLLVQEYAKKETWMHTGRERKNSEPDETARKFEDKDDDVGRYDAEGDPGLGVYLDQKVPELRKRWGFLSKVDLQQCACDIWQRGLSWVEKIGYEEMEKTQHARRVRVTRTA